MYGWALSSFSFITVRKVLSFLSAYAPIVPVHETKQGRVMTGLGSEAKLLTCTRVMTGGALTFCRTGKLSLRSSYQSSVAPSLAQPFVPSSAIKVFVRFHEGRPGIAYNVFKSA